MKAAINLLVFVVVLALAVGALFYTQQRRLFFPAPSDYPQTVPGFRLVHSLTDDGLRLTAFYRPAAPGKKTILFFHGNGDNMLGAIEATRGPAAAGHGLMLVEYRGYGGNPGKPSEAGLYSDGEAAMRWLGQAGVPSREIVVVGNSIGSGPATEMARRHKVAALVLLSGLSDLPSVVRSQAAFIPRWLVRDRFDNAAKLAQVEAPVFLMHGASDTLVKPDNLDRLVRARRDATVARVAGVGHELAYTAGAQAILAKWIDALP
ncbi:alpha/beta hydrolase [Sphingopyxis sp. XHP0097]|uniref:Alpha/beta hydrolase n=1 Tax=Sphingopyxis jiangsuensis TaxID=2871171 RepID=A0ABS7MFE0_9SPHN|nr:MULTISPECIES: alpha/beta hydrolase [Sphingopyxis]MBL0769143.1 alpha/beta hydrolase [Sphingopyxis lutea]MBY4637751.1 alpha/beta hydrolase [Sphingopyxis jiangsuensis]